MLIVLEAAMSSTLDAPAVIVKLLYVDTLAILSPAFCGERTVVALSHKLSVVMASCISVIVAEVNVNIKLSPVDHALAVVPS